MSPVIGFARGLPGHSAADPGFRYAWLEAPLAARLGNLEEVRDWADVKAWPSGRIFGESGEYRWQLEKQGIHAVLLLESGPLPPDFTSPLDLEPLRADSHLVLWGDWVDPDLDPEGNPHLGPRFYAREIPEIQTYPIDLGEKPASDASPRLVTRLYREISGANGEFLRCVTIHMKRDEEKED